MHKMKYIKFDTLTADSVFLFPTWEDHSAVAFRMIYTPVSAGFVRVTVDAQGMIQVTTYGRSESLNMESDPADAELIELMIK